jgi:hypothetical protein
MHKPPHSEKLPVDLMRWRYIWCLVLLLLPLFGTTCFAQAINIRLVNTTNGSAVKNRRISIFGISGNMSMGQQDPHELLTKHAVPDLRLVSAANGEATFELPRPAPAYFYVHVELGGPVWDCTCLVRVVTEELMQKGLEISNAQDERSPGMFRTQRTPGEIHFRLRPTPWWVRVLWPLVKD